MKPSGLVTVPERPRAERRRCGPPRSVVEGREPRPPILWMRRRPPGLPPRAPAAHGLGLVCAIQIEQIEILVVEIQTAERLFAHERAQARAAVRRRHDPDRRVHRLSELAREVVARRRKASDRLGTADDPPHTCRKGSERRDARSRCDGELADLSVGGGARVFRRARGLTLAERHVRLAGTEVDVADEHVARAPGFAVGARRQHVRPAGGQGRQRGAPATVCCGARLRW